MWYSSVSSKLWMSTTGKKNKKTYFIFNSTSIPVGGGVAICMRKDAVDSVQITAAVWEAATLRLSLAATESGVGRESQQPSIITRQQLHISPYKHCQGHTHTHTHTHMDRPDHVLAACSFVGHQNRNWWQKSFEGERVSLKQSGKEKLLPSTTDGTKWHKSVKYYFANIQNYFQQSTVKFSSFSLSKK